MKTLRLASFGLLSLLAFAAASGADSWDMFCCEYDEWFHSETEVQVVVDSRAIYKGSGSGVNAWSHTNKLTSEGSTIAQTLPQAEDYGSDPYNNMESECLGSNGCGAAGLLNRCDGNVPNTYEGSATAVIIDFDDNTQTFTGHGNTEAAQGNCDPQNNGGGDPPIDGCTPP